MSNFVECRSLRFVRSTPRPYASVKEREPGMSAAVRSAGLRRSRERASPQKMAAILNEYRVAQSESRPVRYPLPPGCGCPRCRAGGSGE